MKTPNTSMYVPTIVEKIGNSEKYYDIYSRLFKDRIIFLNTQVDEFSSSSIVSQLLLLDMESHEDITLLINSPGGVITNGLAIYGVMQSIVSDVKTIALGEAASMGAFLLSAGTPGKRFSYENTRIMIHQPLGGAHGQATDIQIQAKEIQYLKDKLNLYLANACNRSVHEVEKATDRDNFLSAQEALNFGLIDKIIYPKEKQ